EYVYYSAHSGDAGDGELKIVGTIIERRLVRNLPDSFLADPNTPPALVSSLIGLTEEGAEIYEIVDETIGFSATRSAISSTRASRRRRGSRFTLRRMKCWRACFRRNRKARRAARTSARCSRANATKCPSFFRSGKSFPHTSPCWRVPALARATRPAC